MNDSRGSIWRKWDLHFHTPSSYDYFNKSLTNEKIIEILRQNEISAVAITDHHIIDVTRINELQKLAGSDLTIFPGIELRSELGGTESMHFIGIFPENCDLVDLWRKIEVKLDLTNKIKEDGDDGVYCDFKYAAEIIHELGGFVSVHAGKKTHSIEHISNAELFKRAFKADLAKDSIDILEIGQPTDIDSYRTIVFPYIGIILPTIICSDNHNIAEYTLKSNCWIKADTTFKGLGQLINEPILRCFVGDIPKKLQIVQSNKTKFIKSIHIHKKSDSSLSEIWFDNDLSLNPDLIAIIGNKGKGKSALADTIGLLGNTKQYEAFSFLSSDNFRDPKNNKAKNFIAKSIWESESYCDKCLDELINEEYPELVKYIPQNFLETICNEIGGIEETNFDRELKKVIFSHVEIANRLGKASLEELIYHKTSESNDKIEMLKQELHRINEEIVTLEAQKRPEYSSSIKNQLDVKKNEFESHDNSKPSEVKKPENDPTKHQQIIETSIAIDEANKKLYELSQLITTATDEQIKQTYRISIVDKVIAKIENFTRQVETFKEESKSDLESIGLGLEKILSIKIDPKPLCEKRKNFSDLNKKADDMLDPSNIDGPIFKKMEIETLIEELHFKLDEPNKKYQAYAAALEVWKKKREAIIGDEIIMGSIKFYEKQLNDLENVPKKLELLQILRLKKTKEIHVEKSKLADEYRKLYAPVHQFIETHHLAKDKFHLNFEVETVDTGFQQDFFSYISHGVAGTFCGVNEGAEMLNSILKRHNFNNEVGIEVFLNEIIDSLNNDKRPSGGIVDILDLMRKGKTVLSFYDFIFSLDYLKPRYTLRMGDKELHQLSPGERGTLLLVFYLLIDKDDIPLVIDQPEENLDNQTVYELLVPSIKEAKQKRQIIIVTHNPNLAVVCDAEQIICASLDKQGNYKMDYLSGAIENPEINKAVVDILEGTRPAFDNRESKYLVEN